MEGNSANDSIADVDTELEDSTEEDELEDDSADVEDVILTAHKCLSNHFQEA